MEEKKTKTPKPSNNLKVRTAYLHQAIMIGGRTEKHISKQKVNTITSMEWTPNGMLVIKANVPNNGVETHVLHGAAVADTILE